MQLVPIHGLIFVSIVVEYKTIANYRQSAHSGSVSSRPAPLQRAWNLEFSRQARATLIDLILTSATLPPSLFFSRPSGAHSVNHALAKGSTSTRFNSTMDSFPNSEIRTPSPDYRTPSILAGATRRASNASIRESSAHARAHSNPGGMSPHQSITYTEPVRPAFPARLRASARGESHRSMSEAMRIARSREEQEELLDDEEQADDDGCYPPRKNDDPRAPNPHGWLPVYTTIHKIRRLIVASIGRFFQSSPSCCFLSIALWSCALHDVRREQSLRFFNRTARASR